MKIIITQTIIEFELPNDRGATQPPSASPPAKPFSFFDTICREIERTAKPELLETQYHGTFLA